MRNYSFTLNSIFNNNYFWWTLALIYAAYHIVTLGISPLPWFDEVYFVNVTNNLYNTQKLILDIYPWRHPDDSEILTYGPIYFYLTKYFWIILGKGIIQFRMVNFIFACLSIVLLQRIFKIYSSNKWLIILLSILIATDPVFIQNSHSGRMDLVAFFFIVASLYFLLKDNYQPQNLSLVLSSLFAGLAMLTTPRVFFLIIALGSILIINSIQYKNNFFKSLIIWSLPMTFLYSIWIYIKFGGLLQFINHYTGNSIRAGHFGGNWNVTSFQYPLICLIIISMMALMLRSKKHTLSLISFVSLSLILFYLLIYDYGNYNAMVLPFGYMLIMLTIDSISNTLIRKYFFFAIGILIFINISIFSIKNLVILSNANSRSTNKVSQIVENIIPPNTKVVGDDRYYYALLSKNCKYQSFEEGNIKRSNINSIINYQKEHFDFEYLVISNESNQMNPNILKSYMMKYKLKKIATVKTPDNNQTLTYYINKVTQILLGHKTHGSLEGDIYKVIKH